MNRPYVATLVAGVLAGMGCLGPTTQVNAHEVAFPVWERELDGLGTWVLVSDVRVFVPAVPGASWAPYQNGYWYWTAYGWTWYSFDPWGAITDHCGHWRHHRWYGWVWVPDPVCAWRPAIVTFFFGPMWIGWYPYDPGWTYWSGYEHGYDDGYWLGYAVGRAAGEGHAHPGFVATTYEDFCPDDHGRHDLGPGDTGHEPDRPGAARSHPVRDLSRVRLADPVAANEAFNEAVRKGHVGPVPGGGSDPADGWKFWARKTGVHPTEVPLKPVKGPPGTGRWFEPVSWTPEEGPSRDVDVEREPDPTSSPKEPERVSPRQEAPREYRVVPARPPIEPDRMMPGVARPATRPARPSDPVPDRPPPDRVAPARPSPSHERVDERPSGLPKRKPSGDDNTPAAESRPLVRPTFIVPQRPVFRPPEHGSVPSYRRIPPSFRRVRP